MKKVKKNSKKVQIFPNKINSFERLLNARLSNSPSWKTREQVLPLTSPIP